MSAGIALVTGGTRGIGRAISERLAQQGYDIVAVYREDHASAQGLVDALRARGESVYTFRADLTDGQQVRDLAAFVRNMGGPPVVLVNNAGSIPRPAHWRVQSIGVARETLEANLGLCMNMVWEFAPAMITAGNGRIVNMSSIYANLAEPEILAYCVAKAGIEALTRGLARDLGPHGITVNAVAPAVVVTRMLESAGAKFVEVSRERTPTKTLATPEEVARVVSFLIATPTVNGVVIIADGGLHLLGP